MQELKILSLKEDFDKTTTQLKTNSNIKKNTEESESSKEKDENDNNYTYTLKRSNDQRESRKNKKREATSQRRSFAQIYSMMFNGYWCKCKNYGHKSIHCRAHDKITP